ncbi:Treslin [Lonchura striata]|uniref:Treslin n=1 Tax=Lonchura striata TaxID=40157 RepID=A0A218V959_9PASE|nr:Treslin [Lonchura striata domestica]
MSCSHSAVFLLDTAGPRQRLQRGALRLLTLLGCRFGLSRLRWAFRFFDSLGGRGGASRGGGFRPPGPRAWQRFEEELVERLGPRAPAGLPGPAPRAALTHSGLKETLLDFQWDRPEIASPAKPPRRSRRTGLAAPEPPEAPPEGFVNAVFLFSPCPHSRRELRQFVSGNDAPSSPGEPPSAQELAEKLLPKSVQELLVEQKITLFWVDTADCAQVTGLHGTSRISAMLIAGRSSLWVVGNHAKVHSLPHNLQQGTDIWSGIFHVSVFLANVNYSLFLFFSFTMQIAEVSLSKTWCPCTAVLSPLSVDTAVLTVLGPEKTDEIQGCSLEGAVVEDSSQDSATHLPEIVNSVLSKIDMSVEDSLASLGEETPVPEWVQRELSHTGSWHPSVLEAWYPASNACGASSDLMESFRLLQVPSANGKDGADQSDVELSESLSQLYQRKFSETSAAAGPGNNKKRRGVPRTPVRQKMKTMPRSLQMLNVARLNVKAQKFQPDAVPPAVNEKVPQKLSAKRLDEKVEGKAKALKISIDFQTEEELQSHLTTSYQKAVAEGIPSSVFAQSMIMAIKRFLKIQDAKEKEVDESMWAGLLLMEEPALQIGNSFEVLAVVMCLQVACVERVRNHLLKTSKMLRQQHGSQKETKVREYETLYLLQLLRYCGVDMLRILCLTEDPAYLTKFLEEILELYMNSIPKILGDIYYGLGTQIPPKLASVLPSDFFSDDSMTLDSKSPGLPPSLSSVLTPSTVCTESDQLEELRTRSAKKRRNIVLARHRSMTEAPQNLRQIEIPKVAKNPIRKENLPSYPAAEKSQQMPLLQKEAVQEVTKVRRNLFNEEILSPSKRSLKKMLRSQSVSAVEGLKYKCTSEGNKDHRKLLTKRVAETPLHKQVSRRLLHKQIKGRSSDPGCDTGVVEESPEKAIYGLKQNSESAPVHTPKRFFFGAVIDMCSPAGKHSPGRRRTRKDSLHLEELTSCQTPRKTPHKFAQKPLNSASNLPRRSPRIVHRTPQNLEKTPGKSPAAKQNAGESDWEPGASKPSSQKSPENEDNHHGSGGNCSVESLQLHQSQVTENTSVLGKSKQMDRMSRKSPSREDLENLENHLSPKPFAGGQEHAQNAERDCEPSVKGENCSANTCESFLSDLQTVSDDLEARTVLREEYMGLKAPSLKRHSRFALNTSPPMQKSPPAYSLRCTADRRQREAAARMGEPQFAAKFSTPESRGKLPSASPPTYEVEIEMQPSGLPKLRIKKIGSCSSLEVQPEASASKPKGGESPFSDFAVTWCTKHPGKLAAACVSPSCCRSFHSTPGKGAGQTYICQSYTPTSCASTVTSPFPLEAGVLQTPSPKQKGKTTPEAINDWPRRKRAAGSTASVSCGQSERNANDQTRASAGIERVMRISEHCSSKVTNTLGEFELEGICRLQDQASPDSELRADEDSATGTFGLKSRKRVFTYLSPEKEKNHSAKRSCPDSGSLDLTGFSTDEGNRSKSRTDSVLPEKPGACALKTLEQHSCLEDDDVFLSSASHCASPGSTPPLKSGLCASSLRALTQSPLLSPPSAQRKRVQEEESDAVQITASQELSPFHVMISRRHRLSRTYSRKKLLS